MCDFRKHDVFFRNVYFAFYLQIDQESPNKNWLKLGFEGFYGARVLGTLQSLMPVLPLTQTFGITLNISANTYALLNVKN